MTQQTSIDAYHDLQGHNKLGSRQKAVLDAFAKYGQIKACTNLEISTWTNIKINQVTPRTYELRKLGYIIKSHKRICSVSGRVAIAWKVSNLTDSSFNKSEQ